MMYECKLWPILLIFHCICFLVLCVRLFVFSFFFFFSIRCCVFFLLSVPMQHLFICSRKLFLSIISSHSLHFSVCDLNSWFRWPMHVCVCLCLCLCVWMFVVPFMHSNWMLTMMFLWLSFGNPNTVLPFTQYTSLSYWLLFLLFTFFFFSSSLAFCVHVSVWDRICVDCYATDGRTVGECAFWGITNSV